MGGYYIGVDVGTFETKGVLLDEHFQPVAVRTAKHGMENPKPRWFEHDAEAVWWQDFCTVTRGLLEVSGVSPTQIRGVGASVLGCDCLPVDEQCRPLRPAILYGIDARAREEMDWLAAHYGEQGVLEKFGHPICSDDVATKILWVKNNEPEVYARTYKFLTGSSYLCAKLTGEYTIDQFLAKAAFRPLYNQETGAVDEGECALFCRPDQLARTATVTDIAGTVTEEAAAQTGLAVGTKVIVGTGDSTAEAVSVGIVEPGEVMFQFGSSLFFYYCADHPVTDPRVHGGNFTVPGTYSVSGGTNAAGTLTRWVRDTLYPDYLAAQEAGGADAYAAMAEELVSSSEGLVMLPYLAGERMPINDPDAKGLLFGLTLSHDRRHIYRAALEAVACSLDQNVALMESVGLPIDTITAVGGGTKNRRWMQIVADLTGKSIRVPAVSVGASYGDALMAAIGAGDLKDFAALKAVIQPDAVYHPLPGAREYYSATRHIYAALYERTKDLM